MKDHSQRIGIDTLFAFVAILGLAVMFSTPGLLNGVRRVAGVEAYKVAIIAVARKILIHLNTLIRQLDQSNTAPEGTNTT